VHYQSTVTVNVAQGQLGNTGMGMSGVGSRYQRNVEATADQEDSVNALLNCRLC
jgi:hypothetical protein